MSYTIEYNRVIYKDENGMMLLLIKQGDNNVYDHNNRRTRNWYLEVVGKESDLWKVIGRRAGSTMGGGIQKAKGWNDTNYFHIEDYVKLYRKKINQARPFEQMLDNFIVTFVFYLAEDWESDKYSKTEQEHLRNCNDTFSKLIDKYDIKQSGTHYYNDIRKEYSLSIYNIEDLYHILKNVPQSHYQYSVSGFRLIARKSKI
ncbi:hypothetical protein QTG56_24780 (plasmid) [Rossellomorea sp. AcN35-11]|nr:hypothetical protein [Rossellomorea aquimaris]WJV31851.1 hypothetical protein QTG56_24780 [Rossellomorea sp. AcN35-11]